MAASSSSRRGRERIQLLASLVHPDAPTDAAPGVYNDPQPRAGLPTSPLELDPEPTGFRLRADCQSDRGDLAAAAAEVSPEDTSTNVVATPYRPPSDGLPTSSRRGRDSRPTSFRPPADVVAMWSQLPTRLVPRRGRC